MTGRSPSEIEPDWIRSHSTSRPAHDKLRRPDGAVVFLWPRAMKLHLLLLLVTVSLASAGNRTSVNYSIPADTADNGGVAMSSANYQHAGSAGLISGIFQAVAADVVA